MILLVLLCLVCVSSGKPQGKLSNYFSRNLGNSFSYGYKTENDERSQQGQLVELKDDTILRITGQYSTDYGSQKLITKYTADENGYRASVRFGANDYKNRGLTEFPPLPPYVPHSVFKGKENATVTTTEPDKVFLAGIPQEPFPGFDLDAGLAGADKVNNPGSPFDISSAALASLAGGGIG